MPQMMPLNWLILLFYFMSIFFLFNIMNYYMFSYSSKTYKKSKKNIMFNWKW
uniref:ATP synthase complex subunit 8 n=1 Tax=Chrysomela vigintipunctata TaxID=153828 RepID=A0A7L7SDC3_CHRVG|nr:ATP synthase F0 subunit 8 [Chrysomela vigintipunctata]QNV48731.1 ATP synthase F0 subunit 8 [Chrysomela vigintipunctata]